MDMVLPKAGRLSSMTVLRANYLTGFTARTYQNDYTPDADTEAADLTESNFTGYAGVACPTWSTAALDDSDRAFCTPTNVVSFKCTTTDGPEVYGFYLTDGAGVVVLAGRFEDAPRILEKNVPMIVVPRVTHTSEF